MDTYETFLSISKSLTIFLDNVYGGDENEGVGENSFSKHWSWFEPVDSCLEFFCLSKAALRQGWCDKGFCVSRSIQSSHVLSAVLGAQT